MTRVLGSMIVCLGSAEMCNWLEQRWAQRSRVWVHESGR